MGLKYWKLLYMKGILHVKIRPIMGLKYEYYATVVESKKS